MTSGLPPRPIDPAQTPSEASPHLPPPPRDRADRGRISARAQLATLVVALIGMLGSTITVVVGDYLQDQRRLQAERHSAYRDFLTATREFENQAIRTTTVALQERVTAVRGYNSDPVDSISQSTVTYPAEKSGFEGIWNAWGVLLEKYEEVRLQGSPASIRSATEVVNVSQKRWSYLSRISGLISGDPSRVVLTTELRRFETLNFEDQPTAKPFWNAYNACRDVLEAAP